MRFAPCYLLAFVKKFDDSNDGTHRKEMKKKIQKHQQRQ